VECLERIDGVFYCTNCLLRRLHEVECEVYYSQTTEAARDAQLEAKRRVRRNWILTGTLSLFAVPAAVNSVIEDNAFPSALKFLAVPAVAIVVPYLIWAALWGIPAAWKWWKGLFEGFSAVIFSSAFGWLILAVSFFVIPIELGYLYGVFGGAINEYRKSVRVAAGAVMAT